VPGNRRGIHRCVIRIPFNRHFYVFKPPRPLAEIDAELKIVTDRILTMIAGLTQ
jgi:type I restriction enzyme M protein